MTWSPIQRNLFSRIPNRNYCFQKLVLCHWISFSFRQEKNDLWDWRMSLRNSPQVWIISTLTVELKESQQLCDSVGWCKTVHLTKCSLLQWYCLSISLVTDLLLKSCEYRLLVLKWIENYMGFWRTKLFGGVGSVFPVSSYSPALHTSLWKENMALFLNLNLIGTVLIMLSLPWKVHRSEDTINLFQLSR